MDTVTTEEDRINANLQKSLNKLARREGFEDFNISTKEIAQDGNNFVAILKEVTIKSTKNCEDKQLDLFIKVSVPHIAIEFIPVSEIYNKELFTGLQLSKLYEELQQEANIPKEDRYKFVKYYEESSTDYVIMENMKTKGFTIHNRMEIVSLEYAELCLKQLAKFHALSYVLKNKKPTYYDNAINTIKHPLILNENWDIFLDKMIRSSLESVDHVKRKKIENSIPDLIKKYEYYIKNSDGIRCLCHGDFRTSNILQKVKDDTVIEVIPIDYQIIHSGCPVIDFLYFIFISTDREFRRKHLEDLKNLYFNTVKQFLKYFSIDVEDVYPRTEFERIYKDRLDFGLTLSLIFLQVNLLEDECPEFTKLTEVNISYKSDKLKYRIRGVVQEFIDWGYL